MQNSPSKGAKAQDCSRTVPNWAVLVPTSLSKGDSDQQLPPGAWIVANLHDELVVEAPAILGQNIVTFLECTMRLALERMVPGIPVKAEAKITGSLGP